MENTKSKNDFDSFMENVDESSMDEYLKTECSNLLSTSSYSDQQREEYERMMWHYTEEELNNLKMNLLLNQLNPIHQGYGYMQKDIINELNKIK